MSSQNYWADNLRILQWMISDVNEEKTVLHDIKSSFCYHVLEQKYIPSSKSQTAEIISAILACDSDHEIWSKTTFDEKEQDCYMLLILLSSQLKTIPVTGSMDHTARRIIFKLFHMKIPESKQMCIQNIVIGTL